MICPYCQVEMVVPAEVWNTVCAQDKTVIISTPCCQRPAQATQIRHICLTTMNTTRTHDDWGNLFNKDKT